MVSVGPIEPTLVRDGPCLGWIGKDAVRLIKDDGIVVPAALPELLEHVHEFVGASIAAVVFGPGILAWR